MRLSTSCGLHHDTEQCVCRPCRHCLCPVLDTQKLMVIVQTELLYDDIPKAKIFTKNGTFTLDINIKFVLMFSSFTAAAD